MGKSGERRGRAPGESSGREEDHVPRQKDGEEVGELGDGDAAAGRERASCAAAERRSDGRAD